MMFIVVIIALAILLGPPMAVMRSDAARRLTGWLWLASAVATATSLTSLRNKKLAMSASDIDRKEVRNGRQEILQELHLFACTLCTMLHLLYNHYVLLSNSFRSVFSVW